MAHGFALHIEDDLRNYLQEISSTLDSDDTDVQQVISSALDEVEGKELKISTDAECSRFLEKLISHASPEQALHILGRVTSRDKLYSIACNPFGSHVLEKLLLQVKAALTTERAEDVYEVIGHIVQLVKDDMVDYITHKFGTFFARRLLQLLVGCLNSDTVSSLDTGGKKQGIAYKVQLLRQRVDAGETSAISGNASGDTIGDPMLRVHVDTFVNVIAGPGFDRDDIFNLQRSSYGSPFLQALLAAPSNTTQKQRLVCQMLGILPLDGECLQSSLSKLSADALVSQMKHRTASHTIEAAFLHCPATLYSAVWGCLQPKFASLCLNPISNFAAQSLIAAAPAARYIGDIFHQVNDSLTDIVIRGRSGVACVLTAACASWSVECEACCRAMEAIFPEGVVQGLATLGLTLSFEEASAQCKKRPPRLSINGCIILQALLSMPQTVCARISDTLVALPSLQIGYIAQDPSGARVVEALLLGSAPRGLKRKVLLALEPHYVKMATLGAASRLAEALFTWADIADKEVIVRSLVRATADLQDSKYGALLCSTCMTELYHNSAETWRRRMESSEKMQAQYEKIFIDRKVKSKRKVKQVSAANQPGKGRKRTHASGSNPKCSNKTEATDVDVVLRYKHGVKAVAEDVIEQLRIGCAKNTAKASVVMPGSTHGNDNSEITSKRRKKEKKL